MIKYRKLEGHSVQRITSDKGRYPTAQLIGLCVFCCAWHWPLTLSFYCLLNSSLS